MEYALIGNSYVENIVYLHPMHLNDYPNAVPVNGLPIEIGDEYKDGSFYRSGVIITLHPFENEKYGVSPKMLEIIKDEAIAEIEEAVINGTDE